MNQVAEKAKTYKRLGLLLLAGYAVVQLIAFYLYYYPPATAWFWVDTLSTLLPQIGGLKEFRKLTVVGDRLALILAVVYLPMVVIGVLAVLLEVRFGAWKIAVGRIRSSVTIALSFGFLFFSHYAPYWNTWGYRNRIEIPQLVIAAIPPFGIGVTGAIIFIALHRLIRNDSKDKK